MAKQTENKMVYGLEMNLHQIDQHTIQTYILDADGGKRSPVTVEHPGKHPERFKSNGEPYAREHESLFNILKLQLVKQGKWKKVCSGCGYPGDDWIEDDGNEFCPVCDKKIEVI